MVDRALPPGYVLVRKEEPSPQGQSVGPSAAAASSTGVRSTPLVRVSLAGPTLDQLNALTAVPAGLAGSWNQGAHLKRGKQQKLVKDGQIVAKSFDLVGARPRPSLSSLEQSITVVMARSVPNAYVGSTVATSYYSEALALQNFAGYTAYTSLFDQYRIEQLEIWLTPTVVQVDDPCGEYVTVIDLDDSTTPTSYDAVLQKQGSMSTSQQAGHYHKWKPHMAVAAYSGAFTSYANMVAGWIDSASPGVLHYGYKMAIQASTPEAMDYNLEWRAVVSFRGPGVP